jgi:transcriptional antiterminator NusG
MAEDILDADVPTADAPPAEVPAEPSAAPEAPPASEEAAGEAAPPAGQPAPAQAKHWYVVKVQSGREDTIREAILKRVKKEGLEEYFGDIVIPVEKITETKPDKSGRKVTRTKERKLYAGYLFVNVEYNDRILYLFRETSGVGDFVGAHPGQPQRAPTPMAEKEVQRMLGVKLVEEAGGDSKAPPKPKGLDAGVRVRVMDGAFIGMDGVVKQVLADQGKVQVELLIFGRPANVDFEYWQVEQV